jgi:hypothetical protein
MPHVRTVAAAALGAYAALQVLGRRAGSTSAERRTPLPGDALVPHPQLRTDHAITIDASPEAVWPWLTQMGWHRGGYYTPEWVDRLLFPQNRPSLGHLDPSLARDLRVGDTIPDGPPGTAWYDVVEVAAPTTLVLRSTTHLPPGWADRYDATIDWTWSFRLQRLKGSMTRLQLRVRGRMSPRWLTVLYVATIVPADFVMARGMLRGIKSRVEAGSDDAAREIAPSVLSRTGGTHPDQRVLRPRLRLVDPRRRGLGGRCRPDRAGCAGAARARRPPGGHRPHPLPP